MTRPEDLLRDTLRDRADRADRRTPMDLVVSRAGAVRRRRRTTAAAVSVVAVAALAVPTALLVGGRTPASAPPVADPSTTAPTSSSSPTVPQVSLAALPQGAAPKISYLDGDVFVTSEGNRIQLPIKDVYSATPYHGGFLVSVEEPDGPRVILLDNELHEVWRRCGQGGFALSADQLTTVWVTGACDAKLLTVYAGITTGMGDLEQSEVLPREIEVPVGMLDNAVISSALPRGGGWITDFSGQSRRIQDLVTVSGVSQPGRLFAGQLLGDSRSGAVVDADSEQLLWDKPGWYLARFSPDGERVLGIDYGSSATPTAWSVFDARSGNTVASGSLPAGVDVGAMVWEDDSHLLLSATQDGHHDLLRMDLDGKLQRAAEISGSNDFPFAPRP